MQNTFIKLMLWIQALCFLTGCVPVVLTGVGVGAGAGTLMVEDRRSGGTYIEDEGIELKTSRRIGERLGSDKVHVNVTSFNRNVLLTGEVPDEPTRKEVEKLAMSIENVRNISNEIIIAPKSSLASRSNDALITSKVKARFINNKVFQVNHIKVVTENGVVYLLGLVKRKEGETATRIASATESVTRVVKVFEYLD